MRDLSNSELFEIATTGYLQKWVVPRSSREEEWLARNKPPLWEIMLFVAKVRDGFTDLESHFQSVLSGTGRRRTTNITNIEAALELLNLMISSWGSILDHLEKLTESLGPLISNKHDYPISSRDIEVAARDLTQSYRAMLDWSETAQSVSANDPDIQNIIATLAQMSIDPIVSFHNELKRWIEYISLLDISSFTGSGPKPDLGLTIPIGHSEALKRQLRLYIDRLVAIAESAQTSSPVKHSEGCDREQPSDRTLDDLYSALNAERAARLALERRVSVLEKTLGI